MLLHAGPTFLREVTNPTDDTGHEPCLVESLVQCPIDITANLRLPPQLRLVERTRRLLMATQPRFDALQQIDDRADGLIDLVRERCRHLIDR